MLVFYELTRACDLVCSHCRACAQKRRDPNELDTADSKRLIEQLSEFPDPLMLTLTGGDPLKRVDIYELIEYAVAAGIDVSITSTFRMLRDIDRLEGKCGVCEFRNVCGGSRARAFGVTGNLMAEEPDCNYLPPAFHGSPSCPTSLVPTA